MLALVGTRRAELRRCDLVKIASFSSLPILLPFESPPAVDFVFRIDLWPRIGKELYLEPRSSVDLSMPLYHLQLLLVLTESG